MVAYKKLTKDERYNVSCRMKLLRENKEIKDRINKITEDIEKSLWNEIPEEIKEFYNKYPQYMNVKTYTISTNTLVSAKERDNNYRYYHSPSFTISKILNNFYNNFNTENYYSASENPLVNYIKAHYPILYNELREIVLDAYKIYKWSDDVYCVLNNITTLNKLKNEFPEAYDVYVSIYGNPENDNDDCTKTDHSTGKKINMCDAIEKVRAEFNNSTK